MSDDMITFLAKELEDDEHILEFESPVRSQHLLTQLTELRHDTRLCDVTLVAEEQCCEFLKKNLTPSNCLGVRMLADTYACGELFYCTQKYILRYFQEIVGNQAFQQLSFEQMVELISSDELGVHSEDQLTLTTNKFKNFEDAEPKPGFIESHPKQSFKKAIDSLHRKREESIARNRGHNIGCGVGVAVLENMLFAVGGCDENDVHLSSVERLDPRVGRWEEVRPMTKRRQCLGTAVLDGNLFALGLAVVNGKLYAVCGDDGVTDTVEVYDPKENQWRIHSSLVEGMKRNSKKQTAYLCYSLMESAI
ncbi:kelch repeat protein [Teladorsagia circumcincta]|uniref:Kelch repeat protein n=1 Tax=Teladorsagia circumcincta TaxID=45464 RepID=A0A2G9UYC1_TELCI|nr:kelch repeat protein [Teladorsagia circumcincta]